jgi:hypothetical protein
MVADSRDRDWRGQAFGINRDSRQVLERNGDFRMRNEWSSHVVAAPIRQLSFLSLLPLVGICDVSKWNTPP